MRRFLEALLDLVQLVAQVDAPAMTLRRIRLHPMDVDAQNRLIAQGFRERGQFLLVEHGSSSRVEVAARRITGDGWRVEGCPGLAEVTPKQPAFLATRGSSVIS
jgi:hypothetical protein